MCDFHSICVRRDGAIAHLASNSHSEAVKQAGWRENDEMADLRGKFFVEAEWNGDGTFPDVNKITRGEANERQRKVIEAHYSALSALLADPAANAERMLFDGGIFAGDQYADIRWRVLIYPDCPKSIADRLVTLPLYANGEAIKSFDPRIETLEGSFAIADGYTVTAKNLRKVGGYVVVYGSAKADFPVLTKVGGYVRVYGSGKMVAPKLATVNGKPYKA